MDRGQLENLRVESVMSTALITAKLDETIADADFDMRLANIRHIPVVDEKHRLAGILSDRDVLRSLSKSKNTPVPVRNIMTTKVHTISSNAPAEEAVQTMLEHKIGCLPVTGEDGQLVGLVTETDFLRITYDLLSGNI